MIRSWYACFFALAVVVLTIGGITTFRHVEVLGRRARVVVPPGGREDAAPVNAGVGAGGAIAPDAADYARFAAEDAEWRRENARPYTVRELRARGDGRRTALEGLQDRVYEHMRRGMRAEAIGELERWVTRHPRDEEALLWLARLLNESGRRSAAIARYRQLLAVQQRRADQ